MNSARTENEVIETNKVSETLKGPQELDYDRKKWIELSIQAKRIRSFVSNKKRIRAIYFLFHYFGLYENTEFKIKRFDDNTDTVKYKDESEINKEEGIHIFDLLELDKRSEIKVIESIVSFFTFFSDKIYPLFDKEEGIFNHYWCKEIRWSIGETTRTIDTSNLCFNKKTLRGAALYSLNLFHNNCIHEHYFSWIENERSQRLFLIRFISLLHTSNMQNNKNTYIYNSINAAIKNIENNTSEYNDKQTKLYLMIIFDLLPIDKNRKKNWLIKIQKEWESIKYISNIHEWGDKDITIINWTHRYITKTIFKGVIPSWMRDFFDWNDFQNKNNLEKNKIIIQTLQTMNDLSMLDESSFYKLKKSAQRYIERLTDKIKLSTKDIKTIKKISKINNKDPNEIITSLLNNELNRLESLNRHHQYRKKY